MINTYLPRAEEESTYKHFRGEIEEFRGLEERAQEDGEDRFLQQFSDVAEYVNQEEERREIRTFRHWIKDKMASTTAGWVAYTPIMTPIELYAGMDGWEVAKSRVLTGFAHFIGLPWYQRTKARNYERFNVNEDTGFLKKRAIDAISFFPSHPVTYSAFLGLLVGASLEEMSTAVPAGFGVVAGTSIAFSPFMEFWRTKVFGMEPTQKPKQQKVKSY